MDQNCGPELCGKATQISEIQQGVVAAACGGRGAATPRGNIFNTLGENVKPPYEI